jgi:hypothetical protein
LTQVYRANVERLYGPTPARLDKEGALKLVREMAEVLDERAGGQAIPNHARQALDALTVDE